MPNREIFRPPTTQEQIEMFHDAIRAFGKTPYPPDAEENHKAAEFLIEEAQTYSSCLFELSRFYLRLAQNLNDYLK